MDSENLPNGAKIIGFWDGFESFLYIANGLLDKNRVIRQNHFAFLNEPLRLKPDLCAPVAIEVGRFICLSRHER